MPYMNQGTVAVDNRLDLRIDPDLKARVRSAAEAERRSLTAYVELALEAALGTTAGVEPSTSEGEVVAPVAIAKPVVPRSPRTPKEPPRPPGGAESPRTRQRRPQSQRDAELKAQDARVLAAQRQERLNKAKADKR